MDNPSSNSNNNQRIDLYHHFEPVLVGLAQGAFAMLGLIHAQGEKIMSAISDFADKMTAHNTAVDTAIAGLTGDVQNLQQQIAALQASQGTITPADQALLDGIEAKAGDVANKLAALDALTPPVAPPVTP